MKTKNEKMGQKETTKRKPGRPRQDWSAVQRDLCQLIAQSNKSLRTCLEELKARHSKVPDVSTIFDWIHNDQEFAKQYARAKEEQADFLVEEILEIADDSSEDEIFVEATDGSGDTAKRACNKEFIARSRLRVDARKWLASKLKPKKYGEKVDVTSGDKPLEGTTNTLSPMEAAARIAYLLQIAIENKKKAEAEKKQDVKGGKS